MHTPFKDSQEVGRRYKNPMHFQAIPNPASVPVRGAAAKKPQTVKENGSSQLLSAEPSPIENPNTEISNRDNISKYMYC